MLRYYSNILPCGCGRYVYNDTYNTSLYPKSIIDGDINKYMEFMEQFYSDNWCKNVQSFVIKYSKHYEYLIIRHTNKKSPNSVIKTARMWRNLNKKQVNEWLRLFRREDHIRHILQYEHIKPGLIILKWWMSVKHKITNKRQKILNGIFNINDISNIVLEYIPQKKSHHNQLNDLLDLILNPELSLKVLDYL